MVGIGLIDMGKAHAVGRRSQRRRPVAPPEAGLSFR